MTDSPLIFTPAYYERMRGLEASGWWNAGMRDIAWDLLSAADLPERGHALDVGCGSGQTISWLRDNLPGWTVSGFDVAMDGVGAARHFGERRVWVGSALDISLPDASVDLVVTLDVLQHLPLAGGDLRALSEIGRVLRPGGHLFIRTNAQAFPVTPDDPAYNFHKYATSELRRKLRDAGFAIMKLSRANALLGFAEIPRELRARRRSGPGYHGIHAVPRNGGGLADSLKRRWLRAEGRLIRHGMTLPVGRTHLALCRKEP